MTLFRCTVFTYPGVWGDNIISENSIKGTARLPFCQNICVKEMLKGRPTLYLSENVDYNLSYKTKVESKEGLSFHVGEATQATCLGRFSGA